MPVLPRIGAIHLGHEVADEGLLVESSEVGAEEVVSGAEKAVVIHLGMEKGLEFRFYVDKFLGDEFV